MYLIKAEILYLKFKAKMLDRISLLQQLLTWFNFDTVFSKIVCGVSERMETHWKVLSKLTYNQVEHLCVAFMYKVSALSSYFLV